VSLSLSVFNYGKTDWGSKKPRRLPRGALWPLMWPLVRSCSRDSLLHFLLVIFILHKPSSYVLLTSLSFNATDTELTPRCGFYSMEVIIVVMEGKNNIDNLGY